MSSEAISAETGAAPQHTDFSARNRVVIALLLVSTFVLILNETIMSVAIPRLMGDLGVTAVAAQWLTTAFLLTMAVVIPVTGFLLQRVHTRTAFMLAMTLFTLGTLVCAVAPGLELLVAGRVVQASGTAVMMPLLMTTVMTLVPPEARGKVMGNISLVISVAPAIGPTVSGLILTYLDWRWLFILVLPVALGALALGVRWMQNVTTPRYAPVDVISVILSALAFGGIVYGLSAFGEPPEAHVVSPYVPLLVGIAAMAVFIARQLILARQERALLDLRTFQSVNFSISVGMMAIAMMALFGTIILLPIYMQNVLGYDTLQIGLMLLPGGLLMGVMGPIVGRLYDRFGPRALLVPGTLLVGAVLWAMTLVGTDTPFVNILIGHVLISVGLALVFTPLFTASLSSIEPRLYSHGSALLGSTQQVAGAAGIALFVALMSARAAGLLADGESEVEALAGGIRLAFVTGAIVFLPAIVAAFFVRKPADQPGAHGGHAGH